MFHIAGLSLTDLSERYNVTMASKESARKRFHKFAPLLNKILWLVLDGCFKADVVSYDGY